MNYKIIVFSSIFFSIQLRIAMSCYTNQQIHDAKINVQNAEANLKNAQNSPVYTTKNTILTGVAIAGHAANVALAEKQLADAKQKYADASADPCCNQASPGPGY